MYYCSTRYQYYWYLRYWYYWYPCQELTFARMWTACGREVEALEDENQAAGDEGGREPRKVVRGAPLKGVLPFKHLRCARI